MGALLLIYGFTDSINSIDIDRPIRDLLASSRFSSSQSANRSPVPEAAGGRSIRHAEYARRKEVHADMRFVAGSIVIIGAIIYVAFVGVSSNWSYYVTVDECAAGIEELRGCRLRVSGKVAEDSLVISADRGTASFDLVGRTGRMPVRCRNSVPDSLEEGREVVVEGRLTTEDVIEAEQVLTRCASKYESQESVRRRTRGARE